MKINKIKKRKRILFIAASFAISLTALIFIILNFRNNIVFFYSPSELKNTSLSPKKIIRVGGLVLEGSIEYLPNSVIEFEITDMGENLKIHYQGLKPDLFRENQGTVAKGYFDLEKNIFIASELLTKHDEKYMPPEVAKALKKSGEFKPAKN